jgi:hypothetical protein
MLDLKVFKLVAALFVIVLFSQCYYHQMIDEPIVVENVSFSDDVIPIFDADCNNAGCHNTGGTAPDLTAANAYNALINGNFVDTDNPVDSEIYQWMIGNRSIPMPLSGPDSEYNAIILKWIEDGAQNN